jgi:hypothetical protein
MIQIIRYYILHFQLLKNEAAYAYKQKLFHNRNLIH